MPKPSWLVSSRRAASEGSLLKGGETVADSKDGKLVIHAVWNTFMSAYVIKDVHFFDSEEDAYEEAARYADDADFKCSYVADVKKFT